MTDTEWADHGFTVLQRRGPMTLVRHESGFQIRIVAYRDGYAWAEWLP